MSDTKTHPRPYAFRKSVPSIILNVDKQLPPSGILLPTKTKKDSVAAGLLLPAFCLTFFSSIAFIMLNLYFLSQRNFGLISGSFDLGCFYAMISILSLS